MGSLKDKALNNVNEDVQKHALTDQEMSYIKTLNLTLQFHTMQQKLVSGFLYYIASNRLGYPKDANLKFELDLGADSNVLSVTVISEEEVARG